MKNLSLYIHFPYCLYKCHYCDFNSYAVKDVSALQRPYVKALFEELKAAQEIFKLAPFESIFLGGGTPSLFEAKVLGELMEGLAREVGVSAGAEITLESNPKTIQSAQIRDFLSIGINRFSIGVQSFQDKFLAPLGRLHDAKEAIQTIEMLEKEVENYNFDLMFGFPGQSLDDLKLDLATALRFQPKHFSFYGLTLEEGTIFAEHHRQGKIQLLEDDLQASMYETGVESFEKAGYPLYEISNFARPGFESKHNLAYWHYSNYLALGAGSVSFLSKDFLRAESCQKLPENLYGIRWTNLKSPEQYRADPGHFYKNRNWEIIDDSTARKEFWMMGLRLKEGVSLKEFEKRFGEGQSQVYNSIVEEWENKGSIEIQKDRICLTARGRLLANEVVSSFFI